MNQVPFPYELKIYGVILTDQIKSLDWKARNVKFVETAPENLIEEIKTKIETLLF